MNYLVSFLVMICLMLSGCSNGPKRVLAVGSITVGGKPAEGAQILLHPQDETKQVASAVAEADGTFKLVSGGEPGILVGSYKVTVIWPDASKKPTQAQIMMGTADVGPDLLKGKYAVKSQSSLTAEVTAATTTLPPIAL
jgi:hypothetical protein